MREAAAAFMVLVAGWVGRDPQPTPPPAARPLADVPALAPSVERAKPGKAGPELGVGDPAPAMEINRWIKGDAVKGFEAGKVYLVEFWATWCPPCRKNIPHLTDLQNKFKDKGLVVIGITGQERGPDDVAQFVAKQGERIAYRVAWDQDNGTTRRYLGGAGINHIPTAFLIDQAGRIAWIGSGFPMQGLDSAVERVIDKTFDLDKATDEARNWALARPFLKSVEEASAAGNHAKAVELLDRAMMLDPEGMSILAPHKFRALAVDMRDYQRAYAFAAEQVDGPAKGKARVLNELAWAILDEPGLERRDLGLALKAAERANTLTGGESPEVLDTLARACFETGAKERAIAVQRRAVELAKDQALARELKERLERYQAGTE